jgi:ADP-ribosyl-[dinitrogen reductase] hydrolase
MIERLIIGAFAGDIGSPKPGERPDKKPVITGDSVLTVAVMDSLLNGRDYTSVMQTYGRKFPNCGYGAAFSKWIRQDDPRPFNSWNNGAALRVSPVGFACRTISEVLDEARKNAQVSHSHPDGIKGAQAVASSVFLARTGRTKDEIRNHVESAFGYNLQKSIADIRPGYFYDQSCQGSIPEAIIAFLESNDFESAISLANSLGDGCSAIACITGAIAQAYYKEIPGRIAGEIAGLLTPGMYDTVEEFSNTYRLSLFH